MYRLLVLVFVFLSYSYAQAERPNVAVIMTDDQGYGEFSTINVSSVRTLLRAEVETIANVFHDAGYRTGLFSKWHLDDNYPFRPEDQLR